jgi:eukaryotic-like serine/threonine-protein kinase
MATGDDHRSKPEAFDITVDAASAPPGAPVDELNVGRVVAGRYRVVRRIAAGGMGVVYEAEDGLLGGRVALKTIRASSGTASAADELTVERFRREIQLARIVTHTHVCRIFDVGVDGPLVFLTMELLAGETLAARVARGPLGLDEVRGIAEGLIAGLEAAHAAGVVHRDFKSANIILAPRAVITDFGLARDVTGTASSSETGPGIVGTPSYMAPEQVTGDAISPATDVFSLGVVLFELVTGTLPWSAPTPLATAVARLSEPPPSPRGLRADLPPAWETTILGCLARAPKERPTLAQVLSGLRGQPRPRRRGLVLAAIAAVTVAAAGIVYFGLARRTPPVVTLRATGDGRPAIAILGFRNVSSNPEAAWMSTALAEMLGSELSAGETYRIVPGEDVARARRELSLGDETSFARETLGRLSELLASDYVLGGQYVVSPGGKVRVDLKLQDTRSGEIVASFAAEADQGDLVGLAGRTGEGLRARLGLGPLSGAQASELRAVRPTTDAGARLYAEGLELLRLSECGKARERLERAVEAEPSYPLAHTALARALWCQGHESKARREAERAVALTTGLPEHIRLETEAVLHEYAGDKAKALAAAEKLYRRFPDNLDHGLALFRQYRHAERHEDAAKVMAALQALGRPSPELKVAALRYDLERSKSVDLAAMIPRWKALRLELEKGGARRLAADVHLHEANLASHIGRLDEARSSLAAARAVYDAIGADDARLDVLALEAQLSFQESDFKGARRTMEDAVALLRRLGMNRALPLMLVNAGQLAEIIDADLAIAEQDYSEALRVAEERDAETPDIYATSMMAALERERGQLGAAIERHAALEGGIKSEDDRLGMRAQAAGLDLDRGDLPAARARIDALLACAACHPWWRISAELMQARLLLIEGQPGAAAEIAGRIATTEQLWQIRLVALMVQAEALASTGDVTRARAVLATVPTPILRLQRGMVALLVAQVRGHIAIAGGDRAELDREAAALGTLIAASEQAGLFATPLEARLVRARMELRRDRMAGRLMLEDVIKRARSKGFLQVATHASRLL